jgi:hypothetical protein
MAYSPQINVVDATQFKDNLIAHFQANQADALIWANGGRILQEIRNFYKSPPGDGVSRTHVYSDQPRIEI